MQKTIKLPWPPSVNHYLKICGKSLRKTHAANKYINSVFYIVRAQKIKSFGTSRLSVEIKAHPPDNRKRDLDNILKMIFDSLENADVFENDNQIDEIKIKREEKKKGGEIIVTLKTIN